MILLRCPGACVWEILPWCACGLQHFSSHHQKKKTSWHPKISCSLRKYCMIFCGRNHPFFFLEEYSNATCRVGKQNWIILAMKICFTWRIAQHGHFVAVYDWQAWFLHSSCKQAHVPTVMDLWTLCEMMVLQVSANKRSHLHKWELWYETLGEHKGASAMVMAFSFSLVFNLFKLPCFSPLRYALWISHNNCPWPSGFKNIITILMSAKYLHWLW